MANEKEKILILNQKQGSGKMSAKVRQRVKKGYSPDSYFKTLNPQDSNDLALLFEDLEMVINAPVEKAIRKYKENKQKGWPFF